MSYKSDSTKYADNKPKRVVMEFLEKYMYDRAYPTSEMITDKQMHLLGADVMIGTANGPEYHGIQTQSSKMYINKPQPMFQFELLADKNGQETVGEFLRNDVMTHVYVLCWIPRAKVNSYGYINDAEDIEELEVMFIDRQELKSFINTYFYDEALYQQARKMRAKNDTRVFPNDAMYFVYSPALSEKPVYLAIKRWALERCAYQHFKVTKGGIQSMM